jgi:cytochrome c oxidase cbb3-type subunit 3
MANEKEHVEYSQPAPDRLFEHTYDGIQEYDNPLPGWWKWIFVGSIVFSAVYFFYYHMGGLGATDHDNYRQEMTLYQTMLIQQEKELSKVPLDQLLSQIREDDAAVKVGQKIFTGEGTCFTCHKKDGSGDIGSNLTDDYWIYGHKLVDIYDVVYNGRPEKGMPPFGASLGPDKVMRIVAYVDSLRGTKPPIAKSPEENAKKYPPTK